MWVHLHRSEHRREPCLSSLQLLRAGGGSWGLGAPPVQADAVVLAKNLRADPRGLWEPAPCWYELRLADGEGDAPQENSQDPGLRL